MHRSILGLSTVLSISFSQFLFAIDESRLWLPKSYERQYLDLVKAAKAANALDRCLRVTRGTIDLSQSTEDLPIFRIQCLQENGRTYNEMVDGISFETLTTQVVEDVGPTEEEIANTKSGFLNRCLTKLESETNLFINKTVLNPMAEPDEFSMEKAKFYLDFDAEDIHGEALKYRAICLATKEEVQLKIRTRR